jgi:NAD(P)-dependent dehydrogenase (short-subunit alcohol dehydrogenase family)
MDIRPGKVALVTGASGGIGLATLRALEVAGFIAVGAARRPDAVEELRQQGFPAVRIDVTDEASMIEGVAETERLAGRVGVLVNNAGYGLAGPVELLDMDDLRSQFETNVFGLVRMCQLVLPAMRERGAGRIINVSSIVGEFSVPGQGAYSASKHAVEAFSDALRVEAGQFGVDVVLVQPTGVRTGFFDVIETNAADVDFGPYAAMMRNWQAMIEQTRNARAGVIEPEDVARVIVRAATADRPRARYRAGWTAALATGMRKAAPDAAWDRAMRRMLGVKKPG